MFESLDNSGSVERWHIADAGIALPGAGGYDETPYDRCEDDLLPENDNDEDYVPFDDDDGFDVTAGLDIPPAVLTKLEDINWHLDMAAGIYAAQETDHRGNEVVAAPSAADLADQGALVLADPESRLVYLGDRLREAQCLLDYPTPAESSGYAACELEHAILQERSANAVAELRKVMGSTTRSWQEDDHEHHLSIHRGKYVLPDGTVVPVARLVHVHTRDGAVADLSNTGAIVVDTETGYDRPWRPDLSVLETNEIPGRVTISADEVVVKDLSTLSEELAHSLRLDSHRKAVEPWADALLSLPPTTAMASGEEDYGVHRMPLGIRAILMGIDDRSEAVVTLAFTFNGDTREDMLHILETPVKDILESLERYGATERFAWLLENATDIQRAVADGERDAFDSGFRKVFTDWKNRKEAAINRLGALTDELGRMPSNGAEQDASAPSEVMSVETSQQYYAAMGRLLGAIQAGSRGWQF